jgi:hypothetical protein
MPACICFEEGGGEGGCPKYIPLPPRERERERERESLNAHAQQMTHNSGSPILLDKKTKGNGKGLANVHMCRERKERNKRE